MLLSTRDVFIKVTTRNFRRQCKHRTRQTRTYSFFYWSEFNYDRNETHEQKTDFGRARADDVQILMWQTKLLHCSPIYKFDFYSNFSRRLASTEYPSIGSDGTRWSRTISQLFVVNVSRITARQQKTISVPIYVYIETKSYTHSCVKTRIERAAATKYTIITKHCICSRSGQKWSDKTKKNRHRSKHVNRFQSTACVWVCVEKRSFYLQSTNERNSPIVHQPVGPLTAQL